MVYVLSKDGNPLMPTRRYAKIRILRKNGLLEIVSVKPFVVKLLYDTKNIVQDVTLGVDSGYLNIGFSAITEKLELIGGEVKLLQGQKQRLKEKSDYRGLRRQRKRYRQPRFDNRKRNEGWLAPSIQHKLDSHIGFMEKLRRILPISKVKVEVANFDIQKINNPEIEGTGYQEGDKRGFWNAREYVLHRDNHKCQNPDCKNKVANPVFQVHHIVFRDEGGTDSAKNLITLCNKCHTPANHKKGKLLHRWMIEGKKAPSFRDSTFMSMVRWRLVDYLKILEIDAEHTYGYETKSSRISMQLKKSHHNDAFCIAGGSSQIRYETAVVEQIRRNNRSLEKFYDAKYIDIRTGEKVSASSLNCGRTTRNKSKNGENLKKYRGTKISKGQRRVREGRSKYQPGDLVKYEGGIYTVRGSQNKGKNIALREIKKVPSSKYIEPYMFRKGLSW